MAFLTVLLIAGTAVRIGVLVRRPSAAEHFRQPRRRLMATRLEQGGDAVVIATALTMVVFGYGHHPSGALMVLWTVALLAGFFTVLGAHALVRRHRTVSP
ncbi:MAG: hypothetical protein M3Z46_03835 [Actinomycetota bacterium]|nr:hypothetical protein [Actinomycetota bacterium]